MTSKRSASYSVEEDILLCHVYLDVSQNPIIGINQSGDQFWGRVKTEFDKSTVARTQARPRRSLQTRMSTILIACSKLRGCINHIENKNHSGASQQDIVNQTKMLLTQDANYSKGFKFDHVWPILRGIEKLSNKQITRVVASLEENQNDFSSPSLQDESSPTPGMNSFALNTSSEEACREYIQNERALIISRGVQTTEHEEPGEGSHSQYRASRHQNEHTQGTGDSSHSQYRASRYQNDQNQGDNDEGQQTQGENEISPSDHQDMSKYYDLLSGTGSYFSGF